MNTPAGAASEKNSSVLHPSIALIEQIRAASETRLESFRRMRTQYVFIPTVDRLCREFNVFRQVIELGLAFTAVITLSARDMALQCRSGSFL
jgi:hypothetical protein